MQAIKHNSLSRWLDLQCLDAGCARLLSKLRDPGSVFLPIRMNMTREGDDFRLVSGLVDIMHRSVLVIILNQEIQGGVFTPQLVKQILRVLDIAVANRLPVLFWGGSAGADLTQQDDLFVETGGIYHRLAKLAQLGVPTLSVVNKVATAGGAYIPGLCQTVIAIEDAQIYLAGPPLVQAAIGQKVSGADLGGARMHLEKTGLVNYLVEDQAGAVDLVLTLMSQYPRGNFGMYSHITQKLSGELWWADGRFCVRNFLQDISPSGLTDFQDDQGGIVCAFASIQNVNWAIMAADGPITARGARKGAEFLTEAEKMKLPVLFIQNTVGFMVGLEQEQNGAIVHGSALLAAVTALSSVKVTLHVGPSFGAGYYALCAQSFDPDFILSWPMYELAVMSGRNAAKVISLIKKKKKALSPDAERRIFQELEAKYARQSSADYNSYKGRDDCMIDPEDTLIALCRVAQLCGLYDN